MLDIGVGPVYAQKASSMLDSLFEQEQDVGGRVRNDGGFDRRFKAPTRVGHGPRWLHTIAALIVGGILTPLGVGQQRMNWLAPIGAVILTYAFCALVRRIGHICEVGKWRYVGLFRFLFRDPPLGWWFILSLLMLVGTPLLGVLLGNTVLVEILAAQWIFIPVVLLVLSIVEGLRMRSLVKKIAQMRPDRSIAWVPTHY